MRGNPIWPATTFVRVALAALIVVGITLVDLVVVWAQPPVLPPYFPVSSSLLAGAHGCGVAGFVVNGRLVAAGKVCAESRHALQNCPTSDCRPGTTPLATSRPHATIVRFAGRLEPNALRASDAHASLLSLVALSLASSRDGQAPRPFAVPHRPARVAGADLSIPRPPPI